MSKNILILSPFFYPEPISTGKYNSDLAEALVKKGNSVTVICSHPIYPKWKVEVTNETVDGIHIIRGGKYIYYPKNNFLRRIILEIWFSFFTLYKILTLDKKIDIVIPVFPPSLFFFIVEPFLSKTSKKVGVVHDLQYVFMKESSNVFKNIIALSIKKIEQYAFKKCDKLILLSNEMRDNIIKNYNIKLEKVVVQYPFVNLGKEQTDCLGDIFNKNYKHIVYSGALGDKQNPEGLISLANYVSKSMSNMKFHFFSSGLIYENLKLKNTNTNIFFHDLLPFNNVRELYERGDLHLIPQKKGTSEGSLPSKLPNLLDAKCNILLITDYNSELHRLFDSYNLGEVINEWDNAKILKSIHTILNKNKNSFSLSNSIVDKLFSLDSLVAKIL